MVYFIDLCKLLPSKKCFNLTYRNLLNKNTNDTIMDVTSFVIKLKLSYTV